MNRLFERPALRGLAATVAGLFLLSLSGSLPAQEAVKSQKAPAARKVIDRYIDEIGGEKALRKQKSLQMTGELKIPAAGITGALEIFMMAPNKMTLTAEIPGMGKIREGYDGEVGWSIDPNMGPRLKQGDELAQAVFQADFYAALHDDSRYESMENLGEADFGGSKCYELQLVTKQGTEITEYYDIASGLMIGNKMKAQTPMGAVDVTGTLGEYKSFGALKLPTRIAQSMGPMEQVIEINEVKHNGVEPSTFDLPTEIRALTEN